MLIIYALCAFNDGNVYCDACDTALDGLSRVVTCQDGVLPYFKVRPDRASQQ